MQEEISLLVILDSKLRFLVSVKFLPVHANSWTEIFYFTSKIENYFLLKFN